MAGKKKTIYLAYDASIEDEKSLQDFITKILSSAGYPIANIYLIDKTKIESVIDDSDYQFIISLNSTYRDTSIFLSRALSEPPHRFFSRFYKDPDKKILSLGILQSVKEILGGDQGTKLNVWEKVKDFLVEYLDYNNQEEVITESVETIVKEVQEELPLEPAIVKQSIVASKKKTRVEHEPVNSIPIEEVAAPLKVTSAIIGTLTATHSSTAISYNFNTIKDLPIKEKVRLLTELQSNILNELIGGK